MLIFKRKTLPKENFPKCVEIRANENGWMNEQIMLSWLQTIWRKRKNSFFRPKAFLIMDSMKSHVSENVKNALKSASAKIAIIPGGLTKKLQPLDVGINRLFKSKVRKLWEQWMSDGEKNYTKTGKLKRASYENVSRWVLKAWNDVAETTVKNAIRKCNVIVKNYSDDEESLLSSDSDVLREDLINLFISESDESDFEGPPVPRSLLHLCRCSMREHMGSIFKLPYGIDNLIIPEDLKKYLSLNIPDEPVVHPPSGVTYTPAPRRGPKA
ncbi:pogo transposable element with KRAB domain [Trichonephila clavipes]|nr:pogo transposable element with KRAB domain [Trichonephila clavipes]